MVVMALDLLHCNWMARRDKVGLPIIQFCTRISAGRTLDIRYRIFCVYFEFTHQESHLRNEPVSHCGVSSTASRALRRIHKTMSPYTTL